MTKAQAKAGLEYGPLAIYALLYVLLRGRSLVIYGAAYEGFVLSTAGFILVQVLAILALRWLVGKFSAMNVVTLVVVLFMGGLTVWFNDPRFIKMKPTIIYIFFAAALGVGLFQGKSYLKLVMEEALPMKDEGWMILTRRITVFFAGLAVLNEIVWRNFSDGTWVTFKAIGLTLAMFLFLLTQARLLEKYGIDKSEPNSGPDSGKP